jgi:hypothetical protein
MMLKALLSVACTLLLLGCATQYHGTKAGAGQQEFANDFLECRALARRLTGSEDENSITQCMEGKGWAIRTKPKLQLF